MSPEGIIQLLEKDIECGNQKLEQTPYDLLKDKDGLNLRDYQIRAIQAAEQAVIEGKKTILLAMATGTGKTRTVLGMIYRFLTTGRFRRILFLVDRTALGEQVEDVCKEVKLEGLQTLDDIYNIKGLEDKLIDKETRIQIATVQGMVRRILYNEGEIMPAVTDYDLIICDEAHRGYILDRGMGEEDIQYRDQKDYQSKYRTVIEYFDAVKIALTATPALQTTEIFGQPVFKYTYREAVIDGYLVDHDAPHKLTTKLGSEGIHYHKGDIVTKYDPVTEEITNSELLDDELDFEIENFNRQVITEDFNRVVLEEIAKDIDPEVPKEQGKALIYAVISTMKPVVVNPITTFIQLLDGLEVIEEEKQVQNQVDQIVAKLQRKKRSMDAETMKQFVEMSGGIDPTQFIAEIEQQEPQAAKERLLKHYEMFQIIQGSKGREERYVVISDKKDKLISHDRGYGENESKRPEDYLDEFSDYIRTNLNEIAALHVVCTKPKELTRESLNSLRLRLAREGFTQQQLNTAVSKVTNEEMAADIISLIRRYAIGSPLISHESRIRKAVKKLKGLHSFSKQELNWIDRMEKYLMKESVLNIEVFDEDGRFRNYGGFVKINKIFQNKLEDIVLELNEYLYDDGGRSA